MTLDEAASCFERHFSQVTEVNTLYRHPHVDAFVEVVSGGVQREGHRAPVLCLDKDICIRLWLDAAIAYARDKSGDLCWRTRPVIEELDVYEIDELARLAAMERWAEYDPIHGHSHAGPSPMSSSFYYKKVPMFRVYSQLAITTQEAATCAPSA